MQRRVMLVILDGWGLAPAGPNNAVSVAKTPNFDSLWSHYPHLKLHASGEEVGLPAGQIGNSEVGHLNIGAGRVVQQDLPRISNAIKDGSFYKNKVLEEAFAYAKKNNKPVHMMGLVSDGGVHSHISHLYALLNFAKKEKVHDVHIHAFTDGRDVEPKSALKYLTDLEKEIKQIGVGEIATISGRYFSMDRDNRWERVELAYNAIVNGKGEIVDTPEEMIADSYARGITDEFFRPTILNPKGTISGGDVVIFFNLRSDRPRQLSRALVDPCFSGFRCNNIPKEIYFVTMTEYDPELATSGIIFPYEEIKNVVGEVISKESESQFHTAETEKYAHVTFFFNGGKEKVLPGEDRLLINSPKVATYDLTPEMSAKEVTNNLLERIGKYDFIVVNYANTDMVGHTGKLKPAISACEAVDKCLGEIVKKAQSEEYNVIITADHGNIEKMVNNDGSPCTAHTTDLVPFILVGEQKLKQIDKPKLGNVAPTILELMGIEKPKEMSAPSLLRRDK